MPEQQTLGEGKYIRLVSENGWEFAERKKITGIVTIAAAFEGQIILVEQYRRPVKARVLELPAGLAGDTADAGESLETAARRELEEETGFTAETWDECFAGPTSAGLTTEVITFFRATDLRRTGAGGGDASEEIDVHLVPLATAEAFIKTREAAGVLVDPKVYTGLYLLR